jgi:protein-tyrosine phosphatase
MIGQSGIDQHESGSPLKPLLKRIAPRPLLSAVREYRGIDAAQRSVYVRLRILRLLGMRRDRPKVTRSSQNFLFVCFGNIMRSPMAAALLEQHAARRGVTVSIRSAGTHARTGRRAEPRAVAAAVTHGVSLSEHAATHVAEEQMKWADVVFAMDFRNETELVHRFPWAEDKIALLGAFALAGHVDACIPDPYSEDGAALDHCYARLVVAVDQVTEQLVGRADLA